MVLLGVNVGFGGIRTLGFQGPTDFVTVSNAAAFSVQDNHVRFLGGFWLGAGLIMLAGALALQQLRPVLIALTLMVFVGGLARLSEVDISVLKSLAVAPSLLVELLVYPLLGLWIFRSTRG